MSLRMRRAGLPAAGALGASLVLAALVALVNFSAQTQRYGVFLAMPPMVQQAWPLCSALYVLCLWRIVDMVEWL